MVEISVKKQNMVREIEKFKVGVTPNPMDKPQERPGWPTTGVCTPNYSGAPQRKKEELTKERNCSQGNEREKKSQELIGSYGERVRKKRKAESSEKDDGHIGQVRKKVKDFEERYERKDIVKKEDYTNKIPNNLTEQRKQRGEGRKTIGGLKVNEILSEDKIKTTNLGGKLSFTSERVQHLKKKFVRG